MTTHAICDVRALQRFGRRIVAPIAFAVAAAGCSRAGTQPAAEVADAERPPPAVSTVVFFPTLPPAWTPTGTAARTPTATRPATATRAPTDTPRPTIDYPATLTAVPTPLGGKDARIGFNTTRGAFDRLYTISTAGTNRARLAGSIEDACCLDWSPDGSRIVFSSLLDGTYDLFIAKSDGSNAVQITDFGEIGFARDPVWSPDGAKIAFSAISAAAHIWVIDVNTLELTQLTFEEELHRFPDWSPDGGRIAYSRTVTDEAGLFSSQIFVMDAEGGDQTQLTFGEEDRWRPRWSPDGNRFAYTQLTGDQIDIFLMNVDGTDLVNLTDHPDIDDNANWSPRGDLIVFESERRGNFDIFIMRPDGRDVTRVTGDSDDDRYPAWKP